MLKIVQNNKYLIFIIRYLPAIFYYRYATHSIIVLSRPQQFKYYFLKNNIYYLYILPSPPRLKVITLNCKLHGSILIGTLYLCTVKSIVSTDTKAFSLYLFQLATPKKGSASHLIAALRQNYLFIFCGYKCPVCNNFYTISDLICTCPLHCCIQNLSIL